MYIRVLVCISYFLLFYCIVYSFNIIIVYYNTLSFGCCDEEISPYAGQIKETLILMANQFQLTAKRQIIDTLTAVVRDNFFVIFAKIVIMIWQ